MGSKPEAGLQDAPPDVNPLEDEEERKRRARIQKALTDTRPDRLGGLQDDPEST